MESGNQMKRENPQAGDAKAEHLKVLHPSFWNYLGVLALPLVFLILLPFLDAFYVLLAFWIFEILLVMGCWTAIATTSFTIRMGRIEARSGILVKQEKIVPLSRWSTSPMSKPSSNGFSTSGTSSSRRREGRLLKRPWRGSNRPRKWWISCPPS